MSEMKALYLLIQDYGDGSYYIHYVDDIKIIEQLEKMNTDDELDVYYPGFDGDGFHYDTLMIPAHLTWEDIGISISSRSALCLND